MGLRDLLLNAAIGRSQQELEDDVSLGKAEGLMPPGTELDKLKHAYASKLAAEKWSPGGAFLLGLGKEVADIPHTGFDLDDMRANMVGILRAEEE